MRSARKLPCQALPARLSRERGPAGGRGGDGGAMHIIRRRATHSFSFVVSVLIFSLQYVYSVIFLCISTIFYETSSYEPHELLGSSAASTRDQMPETRPDSCFSTPFLSTRIEPRKTDVCVLRSIRVSEQSGTAIGMQTTRENIYRFLLRSIRVSIFESTAMN